MRYIFLVEDKIHEAIEIVVRRVLHNENLPNIGIKFFYHNRGDLTKIDFLKGRISHLEAKGNIDKVFILYDSECHDYQLTQESLDAQLRALTEEDSRVIPCVVAHALESWLLYDQDLLGRFFRVRNYHLEGDIEISTQYCSPKSFIQREFRLRVRRIFVMRTHGKRIAENMDLNSLNQSRSFTFFKENLIN